MRWASGEAIVEQLLAKGHLERVQGAQADGAATSTSTGRCALPPRPSGPACGAAAWRPPARGGGATPTVYATGPGPGYPTTSLCRPPVTRPPRLARPPGHSKLGR
jgi:hypothetical protein